MGGGRQGAIGKQAGSEIQWDPDILRMETKKIRGDSWLRKAAASRRRKRSCLFGRAEGRINIITPVRPTEREISMCLQLDDAISASART